MFRHYSLLNPTWPAESGDYGESLIVSAGAGTVQATAGVNGTLGYAVRMTGPEESPWDYIVSTPTVATLVNGDKLRLSCWWRWLVWTDAPAGNTFVALMGGMLSSIVLSIQTGINPLNPRLQADTVGGGTLSTEMQQGRWYHLSAELDLSTTGTTQVRFYIDGRLAGTGTSTFGALLVGDVGLVFGGLSAGQNLSFEIDEIQVAVNGAPVVYDHHPRFGPSLVSPGGRGMVPRRLSNAP